MSKNLLQNINNPTDLRKLETSQLPQLAKELRDFIIDVVSVKEGHLGASLGVIELTIALHYVFDTPNDLLVWDVGHQAYGHKILTERKNNFHTNRQLGGISGFPKRSESFYDTFGVGHSSTSISAALGMAIGDGHILLSVMGTIAVYIVLGLFVKLEVLMGKFGLTRNYKIVFTYTPEAYKRIETIFEQCNLSVRSEKQLITHDKIEGIWSVRGRVTKHNKLIKKLMADKEVKELEF